LDAASEGFAVTYSDEEALNLIEDSAVTVGHIIEYAPSRHVPRIGHLDVDSEYFEFLPSCKHVTMNGNYHCPIMMCHA
jgi:hypothetical protein